LNDDQINKLFDHIPGLGKILPNDKISSIRFSRRKKEHVKQFLYELSGTGTDYDKSRYKWLSDKQIEELLPYLDLTLTKTISQEQYDAIDFDRLPLWYRQFAKRLLKTN